MKIIYTSRIKVDAFDTLKDYSVMMYRKQMAADTVPSFIDHNGETVQVGDHISARWPRLKREYNGIVVQIRSDPAHPADTMYEVAYADGSNAWHNANGIHSPRA